MCSTRGSTCENKNLNKVQVNSKVSLTHEKLILTHMSHACHERTKSSRIASHRCLLPPWQSDIVTHIDASAASSPLAPLPLYRSLRISDIVCNPARAGVAVDSTLHSCLPFVSPQPELSLLRRTILELGPFHCKAINQQNSFDGRIQRVERFRKQ